MACNQYLLEFTSDEIVTFLDCSGNTQTLSGKSGVEYFVCGQSLSLPPSGVSSTDNGPADFYFFSSCCGHYFFYYCSPSPPAFPVMTLGSQYIQFSDGLSTENKCTVYDVSVVPPTNYDIPYVTVLQKTGMFFDKTEQCNNCVANFPGNECEPYYFELCCCTSTETPPPLDCYIAYISKGFFTPGDTYQFTLVDLSTTFCAKVVDPTTKNFYSVTEYLPTDLSSLDLIAECENCSEPCPTPTPTPTPTNTPTPTVTPTRTPSITPSSFRKFYNECEPITIFNMGISCVVLEPTTMESNDGAASLMITGGTPPYTVKWDNGNEALAIGNLSVGEYGATVVDFYGDYTAKTICVLTGQTITPTPTPTPSATPIPTGPVFCMTVSTEYNIINIEKIPLTISFYLKETFTVDSFINGQPSWISGSGIYRIYFEPTPSPGLWKYSASTLPVQIVNTNYSSYPLNPSQWSVLGGSEPVINITEGPCPTELNPLSITNPNIELFVVKNDTVCGCEGSIIANADGGNIPYQYSIDGGITFKNFPIFDDLCFGNYTVIVKDSSGYTKSTQITINEPTLPTVYTINLTQKVTTLVNNGIILTKSYESEVVVNPPLPNLAVLTFDLIHTNTFNSSINPDSAALSTNTILQYNQSPLSYTTTSSIAGTSTNRINGCQNEFIYTTGTSEVWQGLTLTNSDNIIINTTTSVIKNFTTGCDIASSEDKYYISNVSISGCDCCSVQNITL